MKNNEADGNDIIFTIKETKFDFYVVTLSAKGNQKLLIKGIERSMCYNEFKRKKKGSKNKSSKYRFFLESNFVGVNRLFLLFYLNRKLNVRYILKL